VPKQRLEQFEGLRGVAAFLVVLYHYYLLYYLPLNTTANRVVIHSPLIAAANGYLEVYVFFVLSGYVLTAKFFRTEDRAVICVMAAARYPRLVIPVLVSFLLAFTAAKLGWFGQFVAKMQILDSAGFGPHAWWVPQGSFASAIREGFIGIFFDPHHNFSVNPPLWTMKVELVGSFSVFAFCLVLGSSRLRLPLYAVLAIILSTFSSQLDRLVGINSYNLIAFVIGMAYADAVGSSLAYRSQRDQQPRSAMGAISIIFATLGILVAAQIGAVAAFSTLYVPLSPWYARAVTQFARYDDQFTLVTAAVIVIVVNESPFIRSWFSRPLAVFLGKISFPLYLIHFTIMASLSCFIFLQMYRLTGGYVLSATIASLGGVAISLIAAVCFQRYVDAPGIQFSHAFASFVTQYLPGLPTRESAAAPPQNADLASARSIPTPTTRPRSRQSWISGST
jgi:peptidoglycan/LPS O-acetylase OafA/YrhL